MNWSGKGRQEFFSGLSMTILFTLLYFFVFGVGAWWVIFPLVFAGILPLSRGLFKLLENRSREKSIAEREAAQNARYPEKLILQTARDRKGRVTPALIALDSSLSIEEAEKALRYMASHGYASMEVTENGTVEYIFADFLP